MAGEGRSTTLRPFLLPLFTYEARCVCQLAQACGTAPVLAKLGQDRRRGRGTAKGRGGEATWKRITRAWSMCSWAGKCILLLASDPRPGDDRNAAQDLARDLADIAAQISSREKPTPISQIRNTALCGSSLRTHTQLLRRLWWRRGGCALTRAYRLALERFTSSASSTAPSVRLISLELPTPVAGSRVYGTGAEIVHVLEK
jgi:hypothetical protein